MLERKSPLLLGLFLGFQMHDSKTFFNNLHYQFLQPIMLCGAIHSLTMWFIAIYAYLFSKQ